MYLSARATPADLHTFSTVPLTNKSPFFQSPTIHSTRVRHHLFCDGTAFGKLHKSSSKKELLNRYQLGVTVLPLTAQNWKKNLEVNINKEEMEKGLREYLGISQPFRPKTSRSKENTMQLTQRTGTSRGGKRILLGSSSLVSLRKVQTHQSGADSVLRRELMCSTDEFDARDFNDDITGEKFQHIKFIKAPSKDLMNLFKLSNYDVTLVPSDSRRVVVEAIMRDYFLNLIPENSDFLICKNSQSQIYTIIFVGRLVPVCKACSSVTRFEISSDLGFQALCNSPYCNIKVLYTNRLSTKVYECLWPVNKNKRADIEHSIPLEGGDKTPAISKIIQSGKYKITDFSRVLTNSICSPSPRTVSTRPNTAAANTVRASTAMQKFNQVITKSGFTERIRLESQGIRANTAQGLRRHVGVRPGTSGSVESGEFKGALVLKEFDDRGMLVKGKEVGVIEQVSEEVSREEEEGKAGKERKVRKIKGDVFLGGRVVREKGNWGGKGIKKGLGYSMPVGKRSLLESQEMSNKVDSSFEDINIMVSIMNKGK